MTPVVVVIGAGSIGQALVRRVAAGKHILLTDLRSEEIGKVIWSAWRRLSTHD